MKLIWKKCPCGQCNREYPANLGTFYEGSGFNPEEKALIEKAFDGIPEEHAPFGENCWCGRVHPTDAEIGIY